MTGLPGCHPVPASGSKDPLSVKKQPSLHVPGHWLSHLSVQCWLRLDGRSLPVLSYGCNFVFVESAILAAVSGWRTEATSALSVALGALLAVLAPLPRELQRLCDAWQFARDLWVRYWLS